MATAADVPGRYDVVINGVGYLFDKREPVRAQYGYSPTFVPRTNVEGDYGDNQQEFWLTWTQRDWSVGEKLKFSRQAAGLSRMFWRGSNIDVRTAGQVTLRPAVETVTHAAAVRACSGLGNPNLTRRIITASSTNLYSVTGDGTITDLNAHGLGVAPSSFGMACDGSGDVYISSTASGTVGVRKRDDDATYSTFSATGADALCYLNNTLYGIRSTPVGVQSLVRYDTAGTATVLHSWKTADGEDGIYASNGRLDAFGGKLFITWIGINSEMWVYDGAGVQMIAQLPGNFFLHDVDVLFGIPFISGVHVKNVTDTSTFQVRPGIYYYNAGQVNLLWQADAFMDAGTATTPNFTALVAFDSGIVFNDDTTGRIMYYDITSGGVHAIGSYTVAGNGPPLFAATNSHLLMTRNQTTAYLFPDLSTVATTGYVQSSLIDFDSSLDKRFHGVTVDYDEGSDGDGGSIDIAYRLADLDGAYTTLQTGAVSGTEYDFSNVTGRSISLKITLNKGTSSAGPTLKRVHLRASPTQRSFRKAAYQLLLVGRDGESPAVLNDGSLEPNDGKTLADNLRTAATSTTPIAVTDAFGSFTGIIDEQFRLDEYRTHEYTATVPVREV